MAECKVFARRTPVFSVATGWALFSLTLPEHLRAEHVAFARQLAAQAAAYAVEVERRFWGVRPTNRKETAA